MADAASDLFEDETIAGTEAAVDEAFRRAGGERQAVHALLVELAEMDQALSLERGRVSLGYLRGRQPTRAE